MWEVRSNQANLTYAKENQGIEKPTLKSGIFV